MKPLGRVFFAVIGVVTLVNLCGSRPDMSDFVLLFLVVVVFVSELRTSKGRM